jgi:ribosomal protein S21
MKSHVTITVRDGNIEQALKVFKRRVMESGHLLQYKENQYFTPKSVHKRERKKIAKFNQKVADRHSKTYNI